MWEKKFPLRFKEQSPLTFFFVENRDVVSPELSSKKSSDKDLSTKIGAKRKFLMKPSLDVPSKRIQFDEDTDDVSISLKDLKKKTLAKRDAHSKKRVYVTCSKGKEKVVASSTLVVQRLSHILTRSADSLVILNTSKFTKRRKGQ